MNNAAKVITSIKYTYVIVFFVLLSGIFYPFVQGGTLDLTVLGTVILFVGLAGGILVYKAAISEKRRGIYIGIGFGLIAISFTYILQFPGRPIF